MENNAEKVDDVIQEVEEGLREQCQCDFQGDEIANSGFRCFPESPTAVTFRAEISESQSLSAMQLVSVLEAWVSSGDMVLVQAQLLNVDDSCAAIISSFSEEECTPSTTPPEPPVSSTTPSEPPFSSTTPPVSGTNLTLIVSVVVPVVIIVLVIAATLLCVFIRLKKKDKTAPAPA